MSEINEAVKLFNSGYVCSQAVFAAFSPKLGLEKNQALKIGACFGSGMRKGEVCGACTGALMVLGLKYGESKAMSNEACERFLDEFKKMGHHDYHYKYYLNLFYIKYLLFLIIYLFLYYLFVQKY